MSSYTVSDRIKCLDGVDYDVVKHNVHFEWVTGAENVLKKLASDVFDTLGTIDGIKLDVAVKSLDGFQENLKTQMDELVKQVAGKPDVNEGAKSFAAEWADACKYQVSVKYHHMDGGPDAQKIRWAFESSIKYIVICATSLADLDDGVPFKKDVSAFVQTVIVQSLIDSLQDVKNKLEALAKRAS